MNKKELLKRAKFYGKNALLWRRKFIGILPQIYKTEAYKDDGCSSIFEFAKKVGGLSERQVRETLNLEKKLKDMPVLYNLFVSGEVSSNKLGRVVSIATPENQEEVAETVKNMSQRGVETLVKDANGLNKAKSRPQLTHVRKLELSEEVQKRLEELKGKGLDINKILMDLLDKRDRNIQEEKNEIAKETKPTKSRYRNKRTQNIIYLEHGDRCSHPNCSRKAEVVHHTRRFALSKEHNPHFLAPLCREHHEIAHSIDLKVQIRRKEARG